MAFKGVVRIQQEHRINLKKEVNLTYPSSGIFSKPFWGNQDLLELNFDKKNLKNLYDRINKEEMQDFILINQIFLNTLFEDDLIEFFNKIGPTNTIMIVKAISDSKLCETYEKSRISKSLLFSEILSDDNVPQNIKDILIFNIELS